MNTKKFWKNANARPKVIEPPTVNVQAPPEAQPITLTGIAKPFKAVRGGRSENSPFPMIMGGPAPGEVAMILEYHDKIDKIVKGVQNYRKNPASSVLQKPNDLMKAVLEKDTFAITLYSQRGTGLDMNTPGGDGEANAIFVGLCLGDLGLLKKLLEFDFEVNHVYDFSGFRCTLLDVAFSVCADIASDGGLNAPVDGVAYKDAFIAACRERGVEPKSVLVTSMLGTFEREYNEETRTLG